MGQSNEILAPVSRRSMLGRAVGAAAGAVGATMVAAAPALGNTGDNVVAGQFTTAGATTEVRYNGTAGFGGIVLFGNDSNYSATTSFYPAACGGWAGAGSSAGFGGVTNGVYGFTDHSSGNGVVGVVAGNAGAGGGAGVLGRSNTANAVGVRAHADLGVALRVEGPASFSRSGRVSVPAGKKFVDVTVTGGLSSAANVLATLQTHRSGVWVEACRRNYPSSGKVRIYLNKVASAHHSTSLAWFAFG